MDDLTAALKCLESPWLPFVERAALVERAERVLESVQADEEWTRASKQFRTDTFVVVATNSLQLALDAPAEDKERHFQRMRNFLGKSDRIEIGERRSFVLKGFYCLFMNDLKQAGDYFENAKDQDTVSLSCLVGRGMIEFHRGCYVEALFFWKAAFKSFRKDVPELAYLLGLAYFRIGKTELAEKAFNYVLAHSPAGDFRTHATTGLVAVALRNKSYDRYFQLLSEGFARQVGEMRGGRPDVEAELVRLGLPRSGQSATQGRGDPNLTLLLAEHYFFKGDSARALRMCSMTLGLLGFWVSDGGAKGNETRNDLLEAKGRVLYLQGFIEHQKGTPEGMDKAYKLYSAAVQCFPGHFPAQFGLAQVFLHQRNHAESLNCLENVRKGAGDTECQQAVRLLPLLLSRTGQRDKTISAFEKAIHLCPRNLELLVDFANFLDGVDPKGALKVYRKIKDLWQARPGAAASQPELLNNFAVALAKEGDFKQAWELLTEASAVARQQIEASKGRGGGEEELRAAASSFAIEFNISSLLHRRGCTAKAVECLEKLSKTSRGAFEVLASKAAFLHLLGDSSGSSTAMKQALTVCDRLSKVSRTDEALSAQVQLMIAQKDFHSAFSFLQKIRGADPFLLLAKAKVLYQYILKNRDNQAEVRKFIREGAELCSAVLETPEEEGNMFAALLVAVFLLERGRLNDAAEIFRNFQNIFRDNATLLHNLSLLDYFLGDLEKICLRFEGFREATPQSFKAVYGLAFTLKEDWARAERIWKYRMLRNPGLRSHFNFAAFLDERLKSISKPRERPLDELERSLLGGTLAKKLFTRLYSLVPEKVNLCINPELNQGEVTRKRLAQLRARAEQHLFFIDQNLEGYQQRVERERRRRQDQMASVENLKFLIEKQRQDELLLKEEQRRREREEQEEKARLAEEAEAKAREFAEKYALAQSQAAPAKPKNARKPKTDFEGPKSAPKRERKPQKGPVRRAARESSESLDSLDEPNESNDLINDDKESSDRSEKISIESDEASLARRPARESAPPRDGLKKIKKAQEKPPRPASDDEESRSEGSKFAEDRRAEKPKEPTEASGARGGEAKKKKVFLDSNEDD